MSIVYMGKHRLCDGFTFRDMWDYVTETKRRLEKPLTAPAYADEAEAVRISALSDSFRNDPYAQRVNFNQCILEIEDKMEIRPVSYAQFPRFYGISEFVVKALCDPGCRPIIQTFRAAHGDADEAYGVYACCYLDNMRIYFSEQLFMENRMLEDAELCSLLGHELGHAVCYHRTSALVSGKPPGIRMEYSADRAGLIAAMLWLMKERPGLPVGENAKSAVLYCAAALDKLMLADVANLKGAVICDWSAYDYQELQSSMENAQRHAAALGPDYATHPNNARRYIALKLFSESEKFYRCIGLSPGSHPGLHTDAHLKEQIYFL